MMQAKRTTPPKSPKAHPTRWTLVFSTKVMRFDTQAEAEAELAKVLERGERAFVQPPLSAWAGKPAIKIEIEYAELLDIVNALQARASVFERLSTAGVGLAPDHLQREVAAHRALAEKLLAHAAAAMKPKDEDDVKD